MWIRSWPADDGGINLHVQLWRRTKVLVKTDTTLKKGSPLIIGGPGGEMANSFSSCFSSRLFF